MPGAFGVALVLGGALLCLMILGGVRMPWEPQNNSAAGLDNVLTHAGVWPPTAVTAAQ